jgi:hypothetical protein
MILAGIQRRSCVPHVFPKLLGERRAPFTCAAPLPRCLVVAVLCLAVAACQTPFLVFSGRALQGPVQEVDSFAFAARYTLLTLEVRPEQPYSVILRVVMDGDTLLIDAAQHRRWHTYLKQNPNVRIRLGKTIYPARAVKLDDPRLAARFLKGRTIYRLEPRRLDDSVDSSVRP